MVELNYSKIPEFFENFRIESNSEVVFEGRDWANRIGQVPFERSNLSNQIVN